MLGSAAVLLESSFEWHFCRMQSSVKPAAVAKKSRMQAKQAEIAELQDILQEVTTSSVSYYAYTTKVA